MTHYIFEEPPSGDQILHYGVKGMRWGIRKDDRTGSTRPSSGPDFPPTRIASPRFPTTRALDPTSELPEADPNAPVGKVFGLTNKQAAVGAGILLGVGITAALYMDVGGVRSSILDRGFQQSTLVSGERKLQEIIDANRGRTGQTLPKGQMFSRMSKVSEMDIRSGAYATYEEADVAHYKMMWAQKGYQINIKALQDIKMPDLKTRLDTATELFEGDSSIRRGLMSQQSSPLAKLWVATAKNEDLAKYTYAKFDTPDWKRGVGKRYLEALTAKGYGAMLDDVDSGRLSGNPVVLINQQLFNISSRTQMTKAELDDAYRVYKATLGS